MYLKLFKKRIIKREIFDCEILFSISFKHTNIRLKYLTNKWKCYLICKRNERFRSRFSEIETRFVNFQRQRSHVLFPKKKKEHVSLILLELVGFRHFIESPRLRPRHTPIP